MPNPNHRFVSAFFIAISLISGPVMAACDRGQYLNNGACTECTRGYYCPDENTKIRCPADTNDWYEIFTDWGYDVVHIIDYGLSSWQSGGKGAYGQWQCVTQIECETTCGEFYIQHYFDGTIYKTNNDESKLWFSAKPGYYLSPYNWTSSRVWYYGVRPCTNAPANAHYTGAGTPDATDGSIKDANDCPWECDDGWGRHGDVCVPLCGAGIGYIKTSGGLSFNLYPVAYSSPALHIKYNGAMCYGVLAPGAASGTINLNYSNQVYHMEN